MNQNKSLMVVTFLAFVLIFIGYINIQTCIAITQPNTNHITNGWQEACNWLRTSTEEPSDYYDTTENPTWGVMSWWDYGYWITRDGQRPAMCNPGSNIRYEVARLFLSDNYTDVHNTLKEKHIKYIVIDYLMPTAKFYAIDTLAHAPMGEQYLPTKYQQDYTYWDENNGIPIMLNYEEYYRSTIVRLYNFNCKQVASPGTPVFEFDENRNITGIYDYPNLESAKLHIEQRGTGIIAGSDPFLSPYQMDDSLEKYFRIVWVSKNSVKINNYTVPEVKIFEVIE